MRMTSLALAVWCGCASAQNYIVLDLGPTPAGFDPSGDHATVINSRGQVSGALEGSHPVAAIATAGDGAKAIVAPDLYSEAGGINESGNAVGILLPNGASNFRAFFYSNGRLVDMGTLGGPSAVAIRMSNSNLATGSSEDASGASIAFLWNGSSMLGLPPTLPGASSSTGLGVSDNGNVTGQVGFGSDPGSNYQAFVWQGEKVTLLEGTLGFGEAVNNDGTVAGGTLDGAAMWTASGTLVSLSPAGSDFSVALAINNAGVIAGYADIQNSSFAGTHAYAWNRGIGTDLGSLLPPSVESIAWSIDEAGSIFGLTYPNTTSYEVIEWAPSVRVALGALLTQVDGVGPGKSLPTIVQMAIAQYAARDAQAACGVLTLFGNEVRAQRGKKIAPPLAGRLVANATAIANAIGCKSHGG